MPDKISIEIDGIEIDKKLHDKILENGRRFGRKESNDDNNKRLRSEFEDIVGQADEKAKLKDLFGEMRTYIDAMKTEKEKIIEKVDENKVVEFDKEKELALMKAENEKLLNEERNKIAMKSYTDQVAASAVALGLKDSYNKKFIAFVNDDYALENDKGNIIFRDKTDDQLVHANDKDGKARLANAKDIAIIISKNYPDMFSSPKAGFGLQQKQEGAKTPINVDMTARDLISAGIREMKTH